MTIISTQSHSRTCDSQTPTSKIDLQTDVDVETPPLWHPWSSCKCNKNFSSYEQEQQTSHFYHDAILTNMKPLSCHQSRRNLVCILVQKAEVRQWSVCCWTETKRYLKQMNRCHSGGCNGPKNDSIYVWGVNAAGQRKCWLEVFSLTFVMYEEVHTACHGLDAELWIFTSLDFYRWFCIT